MKNSNNIKRLIYIDYLRLFATFLVVIVHISAAYMYETVGSYNWYVANIYDGAARVCVPIFFMISGSLLLNKDRPIKEFYKNSIIPLVIIFFFWTVVYSIIKSSKTGLDISNIYAEFLKGQYHLWFIPALITLYMLVPCLKIISSNRKVFNYLISMTFIVAILLTTIALIPVEWEIYKINLLINKFDFLYFSGYLVYFLLGYYLNNIEIEYSKRKLIYVASIISTALTIILTYAFSVSSNKLDGRACILTIHYL